MGRIRPSYRTNLTDHPTVLNQKIWLQLWMGAVGLSSKNRLKIHRYLVVFFPAFHRISLPLSHLSFPSDVTLQPPPPARHSPVHRTNNFSLALHNGSLSGSPPHKAHIRFSRPSLRHRVSAHPGISGLGQPHRPRHKAKQSLWNHVPSTVLVQSPAAPGKHSS